MIDSYKTNFDHGYYLTTSHSVFHASLYKYHKSNKAKAHRLFSSFHTKEHCENQMDKLFAMPIFSLNAHGSDDEKDKPIPAPKGWRWLNQMPMEDKSKQVANPPQQRKQKQRFALEFDGLNCFETIVLH